VRADSFEAIAVTSASGDYSNIAVDDAGRQYTAPGAAQFVATNNPVNITAAAQAGLFSTVDSFTEKVTMFAVQFSGTYGAAEFEFFASYDGGTIKTKLLAQKIGSRSVSTLAKLAADESAIYLVHSPGGSDLIFACSAFTSGTCVARIYGVMGAEPGHIVAVEDVAESAVCTNVASSASTGTLLAASSRRKQVTLFNDSTEVLYLKYGATASTTSFSYFIAPGQTWEMPKPIYPGIIDGIWAAADGAARITEQT